MSKVTIRATVHAYLFIVSSVVSRWSLRHFLADLFPIPYKHNVDIHSIVLTLHKAFKSFPSQSKPPAQRSDYALIMSFGWSAGDIAVAIQLVTKIVRALNDAQGSGEDYRRTSSYLASVGIVLGQIRTIIDAQKDETYILEPDDLSNLESVVKPLRTLTEQLMNKIGSFAKFEEKGKSLLQRTALEFSKVRWEFMLKDEVKIIVENIDRQIAIWATFWSMISLKIYL